MKRVILTAATAFGLIAPQALADSIVPGTYETTLDVGESVTISKTVTISEGLPTSALVDVKFISDTTGSMGGIINSARTEASTIMSNLSGLGDLTFGASEYKDLGDTFTTRVNQSLTGDTGAVQTGIDAWSASGGGDGPEANLIALTEQADAADWRAGSNRFIVQFGDAPGHAGGDYPTEAETIASLNDNNVTLLVVGTNGMLNSASDASPDAARTIAEATGGSFNLFGSADIADIIDDAITSAFAEYSEVALGLIGAPAGVDVAITPLSIVGDFDRSMERLFDFEVTFTGLTPGVYDFAIGAFLDGGQVATETDRITVVGDTSVIPLPATLPLLLGALGVGGVFLRRRRGA